MVGATYETAVVLTALGLEHEATVAHLDAVREEIHPAGTVYEVGTFGVGEGSTTVAVAEIGVGNASSAAHTERAIAHFRPDIVVFVGVAAGLKDVARGDVVIGTKIYGFESLKAATKPLTRPVAFHLDHRIEQRARRVAAASGWKERQRKRRGSPRLFLGPIASGDVVLASTKSDVARMLRERYNDAIALDMEGRGVHEAGRLNITVPVVDVRGISDLVDDKTAQGDRGWQPIAADAAAAVAFELLAHLHTQHTSLGEGDVETLQHVTATTRDAFYINVIGLLGDPTALRVLSDDALAQLSGASAWADLDWTSALRLRGLCEKAIEHWHAPALALEDAVAAGRTGTRVAFDAVFRTKNWRRFDPERPLSGDIDRDPVVYTKVAGIRVSMPLDPRWATTETAHAMFTRGTVGLSGVGVVRAVVRDEAVVSPLVLQPRRHSRELNEQIFGS
ncbi:MAG: 5'-methylthioadenosine/S-adenosylhomocysteine nucleosidase [Actinomycetota bacterium]|nr:5'-methylthioadenosine/S-adenosylhomocysteine nucleosidase [Actinomycetota bacterium]